MVILVVFCKDFEEKTIQRVTKKKRKLHIFTTMIYRKKFYFGEYTRLYADYTQGLYARTIRKDYTQTIRKGHTQELYAEVHTQRPRRDRRVK